MEQPTKQIDHKFDLGAGEVELFAGELELFAEEISAHHQRHTATGDTLSTLATDCSLSTFGCLSGTFAA
jgi:hypothetical protein